MPDDRNFHSQIAKNSTLSALALGRCAALRHRGYGAGLLCSRSPGNPGTPAVVVWLERLAAGTAGGDSLSKPSVRSSYTK